MVNKALFWSFFVSFCALCESLRLTRTVFSRLLKKAVSMALWTKASLCGKSSLLEQSLPRTQSWLTTLCPLWLFSLFLCAFLWLNNPRNPCNPWLINDLRAFGIFTTVEKALQIRLFMQNKANFRKSQMNVNKVLTEVYVNETLSGHGKNKANSKPIKANFRKARMNVTTFITKDYENISNCPLAENKPNTNPIQSQTKPISKAKKCCSPPLCCGIFKEKMIFCNRLNKKSQID